MLASIILILLGALLVAIYLSKSYGQCVDNHFDSRLSCQCIDFKYQITDDPLRKLATKEKIAQCIGLNT